MNKKGIHNSLIILLAFSIVAIMVIFSAVLVKESGETYLIEPTADIAVSILNNTSIPDSQGIDTVNSLKTEYDNLSFPYDLFF